MGKMPSVYHTSVYNDKAVSSSTDLKCLSSQHETDMKNLSQFKVEVRMFNKLSSRWHPEIDKRESCVVLMASTFTQMFLSTGTMLPWKWFASIVRQQSPTVLSFLFRMTIPWENDDSYKNFIIQKMSTLLWCITLERLLKFLSNVLRNTD